MRGVLRPIGDAIGISCAVGMFVYSLGQNRRCEQVLDPDWQLAHAHACGVIRSSCDRSGDTGQPDFSDSASAQRVHVCVGIIEEMHFHQWCVGIYGHEIVSQVRIDRRTVLRVVDRVLQKRHPNSHHNCAFDLVAPGQRIDDPSAVNDGDDTVHTQASRRMLLCRSKSENGTPLAGPSALANTRPDSKARSSRARFPNGDPDSVVATVSSEVIALSAASKTAGTIDPVTNDPPEIGPGGSDVSPSTTSILLSGTPVLSETSWARIVYVPVPMSCVPHATRALPSSRSSTLACAGNRPDIHAAPDTPHPRIKPSRFIEPTSGFRFAQPNLSAPS